MYHPKAGYEIDRTFRYKTSDKVEARLCATQDWAKGDEIKFINGVITELTEAEESTLNRDFSVMFSSKRGCNCLFCGPARFINHDCQPNCQFIPLPNGEISFKVIKPIKVGEELTTLYSGNYFGENNCECLCESCEKAGIGGYCQSMYEQKRNIRQRNNTVFDFSNDAKFFNKSKKKTTARSKLDCVICSVLLTEENRPIVQLDGSKMHENHCARCYRHELIYDIEWPKRTKALKKRVKKKDGVAPRIITKQDLFNCIANAKIPPPSIFHTRTPIPVWAEFDSNETRSYWWPGIVLISN